MPKRLIHRVSRRASVLFKVFLIIAVSTETRITYNYVCSSVSAAVLTSIPYVPYSAPPY